MITQKGCIKMMEVYVATIFNYVELLGGKKEQKIMLKEGNTIKDLLDTLITMYGDKLKEELFDKFELGKISGGKALLLNGSNIFALNGLDTTLKSGDKFLLLPPMAGG